MSGHARPWDLKPRQRNLTPVLRRPVEPAVKSGQTERGQVIVYVRFAPKSGHSSRSFPPPALGKCRHRSLARRPVAVRRRAVLVVAEGERPHPRRANWPGIGVEDAADDDAIGEHVEIVIVPLAGWSARRSALEGQVVLVHVSAGASKLRRES